MSFEEFANFLHRNPNLSQNDINTLLTAMQGFNPRVEKSVDLEEVTMLARESRRRLSGRDNSFLRQISLSASYTPTMTVYPQPVMDTPLDGDHYDDSGNGHDWGTLQGSVAYVPDGRFGQEISLNATTAIESTDHADFETLPLTISCWIKKNAEPAGHFYRVITHTAFAGGFLILYGNQSGEWVGQPRNIYCLGYDSGGTQRLATYSKNTPLDVGERRHYVWCFESANKVHAWENGKYMGFHYNAIGVDLTTAKNLVINADWNGLYNSDINVSNFKIFNELCTNENAKALHEHNQWHYFGPKKKYGAGLYADGSTYATFPYTIMSVTSKFLLGAWLYPAQSDIGDYKIWVSKGTPADTHQSWSIANSENLENTFEFTFKDQNPSYGVQKIFAPFKPNTWNHVAFSFLYNGTPSLQAYHNKVLMGSYTNTGTMASTQELLYLLGYSGNIMPSGNILAHFTYQNNDINTLGTDWIDNHYNGILYGNGYERATVPCMESFVVENETTW